MCKYFVRVYDDIWPEVVYGPFPGDEEVVKHLAHYFSAVSSYEKDDGMYLLEIDRNGEPSMRAFGSREIELACKLAQTNSRGRSRIKSIEELKIVGCCLPRKVAISLEDGGLARKAVLYDSKADLFRITDYVTGYQDTYTLDELRSKTDILKAMEAGALYWDD